MANSLFTKSDKFTSEYCCTVVRIGEVKPIEGKDKIGYTLVNGETIVVRKDQVKEGDVLFYASNETQLHKDFLSANNLFESSSYELNTNAKEVEPFILKNKELKPEAERIEKTNKKLEKWLQFITNYAGEVIATEGDEAKISVLSERLVAIQDVLIKMSEGVLSNENNNEDFINFTTGLILQNKAKLVDIKNEIEANTSFIRGHVGFFNKTGRVRAIRLGGITSMGYLFSLEELAKYNSKVKAINIEELVGEDFDTIDGELFIKAYVPFVPQKSSKGDSKSRDLKRNKKIEKFDRMVKGEFLFHYSTQPFQKCVTRFNPTDCVTVSCKLHGTSICIGKLHVKTPIKIAFYKRMWNKFVDGTGLFKKHRIKDYIVEYGNVTSSRTVIKNQYINKDVKEGYYGKDVWSEYGNLMYPYIDEGMTIYGEIVGYISGSDKMIQKNYDYGCKPGENKLMIYRITTTNNNGSKYEWDVLDIKEWTEKLVKDHPELKDKIHVIDVLYHGKLIDLYPDIPLHQHWHENLLEAMRKDVRHFGMEKLEPLCNNKVYREGICIRIDGDEINETFKLKAQKFLDAERTAIDNGEVDIEMLDNYA